MSATSDTRASPNVEIRLVIGSDIRVYCDGLASVLSRVDGFQVVATALSADATVAAVATHYPDALLIDMAMPGSLAAVRQLRIDGYCCVVAVALPEVESTFLTCAEAGISAYVPREASVDDLVRAIRQAMRGEPEISPRLTESLLRRVSTLSARLGSVREQFGLTAREQEVADRLAEGKTNKRIAAELHIGLATVKNHVHNVLKKMGISRRAQVASRLKSRQALDPPSLRLRRRPDHSSADEERG